MTGLCIQCNLRSEVRGILYMMLYDLIYNSARLKQCAQEYVGMVDIYIWITSTSNRRTQHPVPTPPYQ